MNNISKTDSTSFEGGRFKLMLDVFKHKKHHYFNKILEYGRGRNAGKDLNKKSVEEVKNVIMRETLACNFDFLKGLTETLNQDLAKKAYKSIAEVK